MKNDDEKKDKKTAKNTKNIDKYLDLEPVIENEEVLDEILDMQQRKKRSRTMKRLSGRIARKKKITMRKRATTEKLKGRAEKKARGAVKAKLAGGKNYNDLSIAQKIQIDKRLKGKEALVKRISKKLLPDVRKKETERVARMRNKKEDVNEMFEQNFYESGMSKDARARDVEQSDREYIMQRMLKDRWKKQNPNKKWPGYSKAEKDLSEADKMKGKDPCWDDYEMVGTKKKNGKKVPNCVPKEDLDEMQLVPNKVYHKMMDKNNNVKCDKRFKMFKNTSKNIADDSENFAFDGTIPDSMYGYMQEAAQLQHIVEKTFKDDPSDREEGTDSLVDIYKKDTPGENESVTIHNSYGKIGVGDKVTFTRHNMDMVDEVETSRSGTVVGSNLRHLRVRTDSGELYRVAHNDATLAEELKFFSLDESFELKFLDEDNTMERSIQAIHRHVSKGKDLYDIIDQFLSATGVKISSQELVRQYTKKYGETPKRKPDEKRINSLKKKYL